MFTLFSTIFLSLLINFPISLTMKITEAGTLLKKMICEGKTFMGLDVGTIWVGTALGVFTPNLKIMMLKTLRIPNGREGLRKLHPQTLSKLIQHHNVVALVIGDPPAGCPKMKDFVKKYRSILNKHKEFDHLLYTLIDESGSTQEAKKQLCEEFSPKEAKKKKMVDKKAAQVHLQRFAKAGSK